ncbi:lysophospholipase [Rhodobacteraceae bacterium D3-12]|nr:lysophospholipase [Rhodobacteraceae bacterium D3-12]
MIFKLLSFVAISVAIYFAIAFGLILSQRPSTAVAADQGLDFQRILGDGFALPVDEAAVVRSEVELRDGSALELLTLRRGDAPDLPILLMVHGSGWHGAQFERLGWALADLAEVRIVTLRGHGATPDRRGDVDYLGQFEDDLADVLKDAGDREVLVLGHSSGGGLVVRMAGGAHGGLIDRAILLAPFLQHDAPTTRANSGGWAKPLTRRIIGLSMLNMVGVHAFDHLTAIQFNMPKAVLDGPMGHTATTAYSWRLNQSFAPRRDWQGDVGKLPEFLLIVGARDEAFDAALFEPTLKEITTKGQYEIVPDVGHLDVVNAPETLAMIREFLR